MFIPCLLTMALVSRPVAAQRGATLVVERATGDSSVLHAADLARLPRHTAHVSEHGRASDYSGFWLTDLLRSAGVKVDSLHGPALGASLLAEAGDGYRVMFSMGEIAPDLGAEQVLVADQQDGAALGPEAGPYRLVLPGDGRPTRGVRRLVRLTVIDPAPTRLDVASLVKPVSQTLERLVIRPSGGHWWWWSGEGTPLSFAVGYALRENKAFNGPPDDNAMRIGIIGLSVEGDTARVMVQTMVHEGPPVHGGDYPEGVYDYTEDRAFIFRRISSGWEFVRHQFVRGADSAPARG
jgi:hypothetical protein